MEVYNVKKMVSVTAVGGASEDKQNNTKQNKSLDPLSLKDLYFLSLQHHSHLGFFSLSL
jgi:hypothetical protein